jgi:hypothetical protein
MLSSKKMLYAELNYVHLKKKLLLPFWEPGDLIIISMGLLEHSVLFTVHISLGLFSKNKPTPLIVLSHI